MNTSILGTSQSVSLWLKNFLSSRSIEKDSGRPLYQYHTTKEEYLSLRQTLYSSFRFEVKNTFTKEWCGAFVLYCSEWFRREYSGDWRWQPIFESLSFELSPSQRSEIVPRGLSIYWGKPIAKFNSNTSDYLGSIFLEGGLPSNLLSSDSNNYQNAFFSVFERYQEAKDLGTIAIERLIRSRITGLPMTLQSDESVYLIASMAEKLDTLVYQFSLDKQQDPAKYLDEQYPRWRESFPLPLESEVGTAFLSQLLSTATKEVRKVTTTKRKLSCKHYLSFVNQAVYTEVTLPSTYTFELPKKQLQTSRVELAIFERDQQIAALGTGFAQFEDNLTLIRFRNSSVQVRRIESSSELYVAVMQAGCKLAEVRLPSSSVDIGESPISLLEKDDKWQILGQSSLITKHRKIGILVPQHTVFKMEFGDLEDSELSFNDLTLKYLDGRCELIVNNTERYVIATNDNSIHVSDLILKGEQLPWRTVPALVFKGVPKVERDVSELALDDIEEISTYLNGSVIGSLCQSELNGRQLLTAKTSSGIILLRKRIGILPKDFEIELVNGETPTQGIVRVKTNSPCTWDVISEDVQVKNSHKSQGVKQIWLDSIGKPPASIIISIRANILSDPILIEVPFPARGAIAYNRDGKLLASRLTVNDLLGSRLHLFSTQGIPANFQIEAVIKTMGQGNSKTPYFQWHYKVTDKPLEVSLYGLKGAILELLSLTDLLDGEVELCVKGPGKTLNFIINHYSTMLEHDRSTNTVFLRSTALSNAEGVKPVLMSLSDPDQKPFALVSHQTEGVANGEYELPSFIETDGPWLIVPDVTSEVAFRAKFFPGSRAETTDDEVRCLQKAAKLFHPQHNPGVISDVLLQMSSDLTHSGWTYLRDTYKNYGHLPLSTFEVWRHLVRNPKALAVAVFAFDIDEKFISHIESEFAVFWEFISLEYWNHAASLMKDALKNIGLSDEILQPMIQKNIEKLGLTIPAFANSVVSYLINSGMQPRIPLEYMLQTSEIWFQELLHQHSEDNQWPTEYGNELKQWCNNLQVLPCELKVNVNFQTGVVYLPLFAAAMASGLIPSVISDNLPKDAIFHLRKLRDFDREWFEPMYSGFINYFAHQAK